MKIGFHQKRVSLGPPLHGCGNSVRSDGPCPNSHSSICLDLKFIPDIYNRSSREDGVSKGRGPNPGIAFSMLLMLICETI